MAHTTTTTRKPVTGIIGGVEYRTTGPRRDRSGNYVPSKVEAVAPDRTVPHTGYRRTYGTTY